MELYKNDIQSMKNIYDSSFSTNINNDIQKRSNIMYEKATIPFETGIISQSSFNILNNNEDYNDQYFTSLTGEKIANKNVEHNNMQKFIKGNVTQNTNVEKMTTQLDIHTGNDRTWKKKQEVPCFFKPTSGNGNVCGMKDNNDYYKSRIDRPILSNNYFPIEKIKVGPGLNKGYESEGTGGFQQLDANKYAMPRSIDELRSKANEKQCNFELPMQAPPKGTDQRGVVAPYAKNRPDTSYAQSEDQWIKTTGAVLKETERPNQFVKPTARPETHVQYTGGVKYNDIKGVGTDDDYGKNNIVIYDTERQEIQTRTVVSNLTSIIKAVAAPILDGLKYSIKEYTLEAPRAGGNLSVQIPEKATSYDPVNHIMKTTVKETLIHDNSVGNLKSQQPEKATTYDPVNHIMKTTVKETLIHDSVLTNVKAGDANYVVSDDEAKTTNRQTLKKVDTIRNIGNNSYKVYVYDPDMVVKTTTKETTIKGKSEFGFLGGILEGLIGGYTTKEIDLKNTNKQFTSDVNEYGIAGAATEFRQQDKTQYDNAEIDGTREAILIAAGHTPNPGNMNVGVEPDDISMTTRKQFENSIAQRETGNIGVTYQSTPAPIDSCSITKQPENNNAFEKRLDSSLLESLSHNDLAIKINPLIPVCNY